MCMVVCLSVCLCTVLVPGAQEGQKRVSDPLELDLQKVVNHHVSAGKQTWVLWKSSALNYWANLFLKIYLIDWLIDFYLFLLQFYSACFVVQGFLSDSVHFGALFIAAEYFLRFLVSLACHFKVHEKEAGVDMGASPSKLRLHLCNSAGKPRAWIVWR